ncbi:E3 ubiquitin protein ligase DRIP2-like isoform X2 [Mangifera indica]|uniref:E3 ubiquitin protein ligase DRIP2-like isoform X2 n=1 Tax=Mangifera indica TaxID=29780 RepID=UPI001CFA4D3A|nr:E3 ubiquitin protein ligase DRIP2-like isoform X2 [Mangifera indica]
MKARPLSSIFRPPWHHLQYMKMHIRGDSNLRELRFKLFPSRRINSGAPEAVCSIPLPARRKERSLSSLVVNTPKVPAKPSLNGRRSKPGPKKHSALQESDLRIQEPVQDIEDHHESISSPEIISKIALHKRQEKISSAAETSNQRTPDKDTEENTETLDGKADLWKPLNFLVDAASKTKSNKSNSQTSVAKTEFADANDNKRLLKAKVKECGNATKGNDNENDAIPGPSSSGKPRKSQGRPKKAAASEVFNVSAQSVVDTNSKHDGRFGPIWFSLVASDDQEGDAPLPQISSCYLRVKDGSLPVSFIKKYLVKKLNLASEAEVEISLQGQPLLPTLQLHNLINWWVQTGSTSERIQTFVGGSAKDFVMVLSYGRKA